MADKKEQQDVKPQSENTRNLINDLYMGTAEKTVAESSTHADSFIKPYNPCDLWQKAGDYSIFEEMRKDDQVHAGMQLKKDLVIGSGWSIVSNDDGQEDLVDDLTSRLSEDPEDAFEDHLEELVENAYSFGFVLSEKLFQLREDQSLTFKELKSRHPDTWLIHTDKHGNISKFEQHGMEGLLDINPKSLIHYRINPLHQNPYGTSDLRTAYAAWFSKRQFIRYYAIFAEKHMSPTPVAKYDTNTPQSKVTEMFNIIKKFQTKTAITIPKAFEVEFLESKSNGEAYIKGINMFNMFIGRSLLVPDLLGLTGSETSGGSFSLGKEQMAVFFKHIQRRRKAIERIVNRHIIQPIVVWNNGHMDNYPKFQFDPISDNDAIEYAKTFVEAMKGRLYRANDEEINHFRGLIKFPKGEIQEPEKPEPFPPGNTPLDTKESKPLPQEQQKELEDKKKEEKKDFKKEFKPLGEFDSRVDYKAAAALLQSSEDKILSEAMPLIEKIYDDLYSQIQKKKILLDPAKPERIDTIKLKHLGALQQVIKRQFKQHFIDSKIMARGELFKAKFSQPLPSDEFLEFLEQESFQYIGDFEYAISKGARLALMNAIKDGTPLSQVINLMDDKLKKASMVSIERYSRTKTTEIMNRGRVAEFEASKAVHGYQFSAILDDRTTAICSGLHGKKFKAGSEVIPPLHFNCRSILLPITIFEEFEPDKKVGKTEINTFIDDNKGVGFSTK